MEYILCAAVWYDTKEKHNATTVNIDSGYVVTGRRHGDCFNLATMTYKPEDRVKMLRCSTQGFLTSTNRFVDRKEALEIATKAGQLKNPKLPPYYELISEDLY